MRKVITAPAFLLVFLIALPYGLAGWGERELTDQERASKAPGKTLAIEAGTIHYVDRGPQDGPAIVMVHGFSTPHFIFEQNAQAMAEAGYRVIQFDHFGRGWSDRPKADYDIEFYDRELLQVFDALSLTEPLGLIGLSMGGVISAEFAARHPGRVSKLALLVPAGLQTSTAPDSLANRLLMTPGVGDWFWRVFGKRILLGRSDDESVIPASHRLQGELTQQYEYKGYFEALLSSYRHLPLRDRDEAFVRAAQNGIPMLAIFGDADETIPIASADQLASIVPEATIEVIKGGTHGLNFQMFDVVNPLLSGFFDR